MKKKDETKREKGIKEVITDKGNVASIWGEDRHFHKKIKKKEEKIWKKRKIKRKRRKEVATDEGNFASMRWR